MWYICNVLYAVLYVRVSYFVMRGCAVSRRYIHVCNCDMLYELCPVGFLVVGESLSVLL